MDEPILNNKQILDIRTSKLETLEYLLLVGLIYKDYSGGVTVDVLERLTTWRYPPDSSCWLWTRRTLLETQSVHNYDDKVMAVDSFVVPSAVKFVFAKRDFHMSADLGPHTLFMGPGP